MTAVTSRIAKLNPTFLSIALFCLVSFIWGIMEVIVQHIPGGYPIYQIIWVRYATHLVFMLIIFGPRYGVQLVTTRKLGLQLLRSVMMLIMPISYVLATNYMSVRNILSIFWLLPLLTVVLANVLMGERTAWFYWAAAAAGSVFLAYVLHPNRQVTGLGLILAFIMGLSFSLYIVMTRMLREESRITNLFYTGIGVIIPLSVGLTIFWKPLSLVAGLLIVIIGLLGFVVLWMMDKALETTEASVLAPFLATQMVWIVVINYALRIFS